MTASGADESGGTAAASSHVLVLHSQRRELPIVQEWERGIRDELAKQFGDAVQVDSEYFDFHRLEGAEERRALLDLVLSKYRSIEPRVVIPVNDAIAMSFARQNPFPNAAVVYCSILEATRERLPQAENQTGVVYRFAARRTLHGARQLFPGLRTVVVVSGTGEQDRYLLDLVRADLEPHDEDLPGLKIEYWTGVPLDEVCSRAARLGPDHALLFNSFMEEPGGAVKTVPRDVLSRIATASQAPVFALYDTLLGTGIVGGCMAPVEEQGRLTGEIAARVLRGESASRIPFSGTEMNRFLFDDAQLRRWGIREADLPAGSVVLFRQPSFWREYRRTAIATVAVVGLETLLLAMLLVQSRRRRRAERALGESRRQAELLAGRLITAQEDERRRIARELHDDISQRLAVGAIEAGKAENDAAHAPDTRASFATLKERFVALSDDVHRLSRQLHPAILDDLGLHDALRAECGRAAERCDAIVEYHGGPLPDDLPRHLAFCAYRIVQEALQNAVRHARAPRIDVTVRADLEYLELEVRDAGVGFDPIVARRQAGVGLASMEERVRIVDGEISVDAAPGRGARVNVRIPLSHETESQ